MSIHIYKNKTTKTQVRLFNALTKLVGPIGMFLEYPVIVGNNYYLVDIMSLKGKVAIEVDGASHTPYREYKDLQKNRDLRDAGYRVIRVRDKYLRSESGIQRVASEIAKRIK